MSSPPSQPTAAPWICSRSSSIVSFDNMHEEAFPSRTSSVSSASSTSSQKTLDTRDIAAANRFRYASHVAAMFGVSPTTLAAPSMPTSTYANGHGHL